MDALCERGCELIEKDHQIPVLRPVEKDHRRGQDGLDANHIPQKGGSGSGDRPVQKTGWRLGDSKLGDRGGIRKIEDARQLQVELENATGLHQAGQFRGAVSLEMPRELSDQNSTVAGEGERWFSLPVPATFPRAGREADIQWSER
jgi:hypothetical protein